MQKDFLKTGFTGQISLLFDIQQLTSVYEATSWMTKESEFESWWGQEFSLLHVVQTGSGVYPTSYPMGTGALSLGVKRPGSEPDR
jgi:hypothetical protein